MIMRFYCPSMYLMRLEISGINLSKGIQTLTLKSFQDTQKVMSDFYEKIIELSKPGAIEGQ